jgi:RimJ/RimL family protein N-acetyltransferase
MMPAMPETPLTEATEAASAPTTASPILRGERVWLSASDRADIVADLEWINDSDVGHHLGLKGPVGRDGAEQFATEVLSQVGKSVVSFSIRLVADDTRIGGTVLRGIDRENGSAEVAIFIGRPYLGQGHGTDALNCLLDFGFGELRLERIYLHVFDYNERARRSYEKAGLVTEAILRRHRFHRGQHHDVYLMAILRDDWLALDRRRAWEEPAD